MSALTQRERLASLEAAQGAHATAHELTDRVWAAKLEAIDARLRNIERALLDPPLPHGAHAGEETRWRPNRRDIAVVGGSAGVTSLAWWILEAAGVLAAA